MAKFPTNRKAPATTYIKDLLSPAWRALTSGQRVSWFTFAAANPIVSSEGSLNIVTGWTMFIHVNSWLSIADVSYILSDPPPDLSTPLSFNLQGTLWPIKSLTAGGSTARNGLALLDISPATPLDRLCFVLQPAAKMSALFPNSHLRAHSSIIFPGDSSLHDFSTRLGYSISTPANLTRLKINGPWARSHPGQPIANLVIVSTTNGRHVTGTVLNSK
jgi:hypothetical protein